MISGFRHDIDNCLDVLEKGGLILYPTDTIWGIGCDATNPQAVEKVYALKKRPDEKSLIVLLADEKDILQYITQPNPMIADYLKGLGKPTTVIYDGAVGFADNLVPADGTIAIRVVKDPFCKMLIKQFGKPIVSTSANLSGYPPPSIFNDIDMAIRNGVDYVVEHRHAVDVPGRSSSIQKCNDECLVTAYLLDRQ